MAITLADVAKLEKSPLNKGFLDIFLMENEMSQFVPIVNVDTMKARRVRTRSLPSVTWRQLNEGFSESKGSWDWVEESVFSVGAYIDVDEQIEKDKSLIKSPRAAQTELFSKTLAYEFNDVLINGDPSTDENQPLGINSRVAELDSTQTIDGGGLDLSTGSNRDTNGLAFLDYLDQLLYQCDGHKADMILINDKGYLALQSILMRKGLWSANKDQFGRSIAEYRGAKIIDPGFKADQSTRILPTNMDTNSSIFALKFGDEYLHMLQYTALKVTDVGRLEAKPVLRTEVEWVWGLMQPHPRGMAKLKNVKFN